MKAEVQREQANSRSRKTNTYKGTKNNIKGGQGGQKKENGGIST